MLGCLIWEASAVIVKVNFLQEEMTAYWVFEYCLKVCAFEGLQANLNYC
jgi:hypothetical protein